MLFPERMKKIELLVLKSDVDAVMRYLGFAGCLQLISEPGEEPAEQAPSAGQGLPAGAAAQLMLTAPSGARFLGIEEEAADADPSPAPPREELRDRTLAVAEAVKNLVAEESSLVQRRLNLKQTVEEFGSFSRMKVPFGEFDSLSWLTVRTGTVQPDRLELLAGRLRRRALVLPLGRPGQFLAVAPRKGRWALDSELRRVEFQEARLPAGARGTPAEMMRAAETELAATDTLLEALEQRKRLKREELRAEVEFLLVHLGIDSAIDAVIRDLAGSGTVQKITGWVPQRRFAEVAHGLDALMHGRLALRSFDPEELPEVRAGAARVPVSVRHGTVVHGFERMVFSYSVPLYGTMDPTPFVAVIFVLLFAVMFGDVGQ